MRQTQALIDMHREAIAEFADIWAVMEPIRKQCFEDRRFCDERGAQWDGALGEQYENKPRFEVNKVHLAVIRLLSDYRNNPVGIDFVSKDGQNADKLADTCDMLMRADEQESNAEDAKTSAFDEAVKGGFGAMRLRADYEDDDDPSDERQRIIFEPINDADLTVFFDIDAKKQDKSDATRCFVLVPYTLAKFKDEFGHDPSTWPQETITQWGQFNWITPDVVWVAEYYRKTEKKHWEYTYTGPLDAEEIVMQSDIDADENLIADLEARGFTQTKKRRVEQKVCRKYIISGERVEEDCGEIPGGEIPIIPMYGKRSILGGVEHCSGHVRNAKDPQRLANMQRSKLAEISMFSSVEKPIFANEQIALHSHMWADDDVQDYKYLLAEPLRNADGTIAHVGPLGYTKPPQVPPALAALMQVTEQDLSDVLGNPEQGEQIASNIAARAVEMVQDKLDMQAFIYISNAAKFEKRAAEVWLSMARVLYSVKGRKMRGVDAAGQPQVIEMQRPMDTDTGMVIENDLSRAKFQVIGVPGPSSSTKKKGMVQSLTNVIAVSQDPQTRSVLEGLILMNLEGEGMSDVNAWARKRLVASGAIQPTDEEKAEMQAAQQNAKPDANEQYLQAAAQEAAAKAGKAAADTELTKAKTLETLSNIDATQQDQALAVLDRMQGATQNVDVVNMNPQGGQYGGPV
jgi:hypothetical protein